MQPEQVFDEVISELGGVVPSPRSKTLSTILHRKAIVKRMRERIPGISTTTLGKLLGLSHSTIVKGYRNEKV
jgi:hypothetical protein